MKKNFSYLYNRLTEKSHEKYKKKDYISAILMQFIIIEETIRDRMVGICVQNRKLPMKLIIHLTQNINFYNLVTNFSKVIPDNQSWKDIYEKADEYRRRRNKIVHELDKFKNFSELNKYIRDTWKIGKEISNFLCLN